MSLAAIIQVLARSYKILSSRNIYYFKDRYKAALRAHIEEQTEMLNKLKFYMERTRFGPNRFSEGFILTVNSVFELHKTMKTRFDCPFLMTSRICQDYVESKFSVYRSMDGRGGKRVPTCLELGYRIQKDTVSQFLKDQDIDIFDLKDTLVSQMPASTSYQGK